MVIDQKEEILRDIIKAFRGLNTYLILKQSDDRKFQENVIRILNIIAKQKAPAPIPVPEKRTLFQRLFGRKDDKRV